MHDLDRNKALARTFFATFSSGDVPGILALMHDEGSWWVAGTMEGMSGSHAREPFGALLEGAKSLYVEKALRITPTSMIAEADKVAVEADSFATMTDGRLYANRYHFLITIRDGKIFEVREYMDTEHARETFFTTG